MRLRIFLALALSASLSSYTADVTPERKAALDQISARSLQAHVSFLASDLLEGRDTPSPGLDIAAEYIATQFRAAGLKPAAARQLLPDRALYRFRAPLGRRHLFVFLRRFPSSSWEKEPSRDLVGTHHISGVGSGKGKPGRTGP